MVSKVSVAGLTPLGSDPRAAVPTRDAAVHLGREEQTLRKWAIQDSGPIRPLRVHGRLMWPTAEIRRVLGVAA